MAQMVKEDKLKALDAALCGQIEKQFGKGSVMKLGDSAANMNCRDSSYGISEPGYCSWNGRSSKRKDHRDLRTRVQRKDYSGSSYGCGRSEEEESPVLSMRSMLWIPLMPRISALILTIFIFLSQIMESRTLEITETMVRSGAVDIIIVDSVAALVPRAEIEGDMGILMWDSRQGYVTGTQKTYRPHQQVKLYRDIYQSAS